MPVRARVVDCLTEPGIVRFPVAHRPKRGPVFEEATGKRYEAREGVSTALARTGTEGGRTATVLPIPAREDDVRAERFAPENFLSVFPASAQRTPQPSGSVRARVVDCLTEPGIVRFPVAQRPKRGPVFEEATGKRYEAREGVSTALARTGPEGGRTGTTPPSIPGT